MDYEVKKISIYFDMHSFHMCHTYMSCLQSLGKSETKIGPTLSLFVLLLHQTKLKREEQGVHSVLKAQLIRSLLFSLHPSLH